MKACFKRIFCVMICLVMCLAVVPFFTVGASANDAARAQREAFADIAYGELGVSGRPNKYTYWYGALGGSFSYAWCAAFVSWSAAQAGVPSDVIRPSASAGVNSFNVPYYTYKANAPVQKGDILYCTNNYGNHSAIVYDVDDTYIYSIEGNMTNSVCTYKYYRSTGYITWSKSSQWQKISYYGVPDYTGKTEAVARKCISSGTCGSSLNWVFYNDGTLLINGSGSMNNYTNTASGYTPWYSYVNGIVNVVVGSGVTSVGSKAFSGCRYLENVTILNRNCTIYDASLTIDANAQIRGYAGSFAEAYAQKYSRDFVSLGGLSAVTGAKLVTQDSTSVTLSWNAVPNASRYYIYTYESGAWKSYCSTVCTAKKLTGLTPGKDYYFRIRAAVSFESFTYVGDMSATVAAGTGTAAVTGLSSTGSTSSSVTLSWAPQAGASSYQLYWMKNGAWTRYTTLTSTQIKVAGISSSTAYSFKVRALRKGASGVYVSSFSDQLTVGTSPAKATGLTQTKHSSASVTISWSAVKGAMGYRVYMYKDGGWKLYGLCSVASKKISGLSPNTDYYFRVSAYYSPGTVTLFGPMSDSLRAVTGPAAVVNVRCQTKSAEDGTAVLAWNIVNGADGYYIYSIRDGAYSYLASVRSYTLALSGLDADATSSYAVRAHFTRDGVKYVGDFSAPYTLSF